MISHIHGDTFDKVVTIPTGLADGYFAGWEVRSQIRELKTGELIEELVCAWADPVTTRTLSVRCLDTSAWPIGHAEFDIQFKRPSDGFTLSTKRHAITVERGVTE